MKNVVLIAVTLALVLSAVLFAAAPVYAMSARGACRSEKGLVDGSAVSAFAQLNGGIKRGPDACGSLVPAV